MRRKVVAVGALVALASLAACGEDEEPDPVGEAEAGVRSVLVERLSLPADAIDVACPPELEVVAGAEFACTVTVAGTPADLDLRVADDGTVELREAVIPTADAEDYLATELAVPAEGPVLPDCGEAPVVVAAVDTEFRCSVVRTVDGAARTVVVTVLGLDGTVRYRVEPAPTDPGASPGP